MWFRVLMTMKLDYTEKVWEIVDGCSPEIKQKARLL